MFRIETIDHLSSEYKVDSIWGYNTKHKIGKEWIIINRIRNRNRNRKYKINQKYNPTTELNEITRIEERLIIRIRMQYVEYK